MGCAAHDIEAPHVTNATDGAHPTGPPRHLLELLPQPGAVLANRSEELRIRESVQHMQRHRRDERTAPEGRPVIPCLDRPGDLVRHEDRTHWKSARDRLGECENVRLHAETLVREERPRPPETALDLIEDQR